MSDYRQEIPAAAYISKLIIQEADKAGALDDATRSVEKLFGMPENSYSIRNISQVVGLLYCLIVVPKELWLRDGKNNITDNIDKDWLFGIVSITKKSNNFDNNPCLLFLKHLRNAVSHVRFEINEAGDFTFWDKKYDSSPEIFRAHLSVSNLELFLSHIGADLAKYGLDQRKYGKLN